MDLASEENGGKIVFSSSVDYRYPLENINSDEESFWSSTGSFPQEIVVQLGNVAKVNKIKTKSKHVKRLVILAQEGKNKVWEEVSAIDLSDGSMQQETHMIDKVESMNVKVRIESGYKEFVQFHGICIFGK